MASQNQSKRTQEWRAQKEAEWAVVDEDWNTFPKLPGAHLLWHKASRKKWELKSKNGPLWAVLTTPLDTDGCGVTVGTTEYVVHQDGRANYKSKQYQSRHVQVLDSSGSSVMSWTGGHYRSTAGTRFMLSGGRQLTFPVRRHGRSTLMSAIEEGGSGASLITYRMERGTMTLLAPKHSLGQIFSVEIVVSPDGLSVPDVALLVALTSHLPWFYGMVLTTPLYT